ncbi:hypothetical protein GUJ93_ZPchr0012g20926 [Zizania palustris]|uniref:Polysaccharide biosynthesis domain-containing protein n=1 Tax=Zizania palustris TaxID=103762 RepID=A0A8J5WKL0_ZIZPA|nr:hypothetical protein GUJ93_ZPchr0012g20926 [Zizania palustris]
MHPHVLCPRPWPLEGLLASLPRALQWPFIKWHFAVLKQFTVSIRQISTRLELAGFYLLTLQFTSRFHFHWIKLHLVDGALRDGERDAAADGGGDRGVAAGAAAAGAVQLLGVRPRPRQPDVGGAQPRRPAPFFLEEDASWIASIKSGHPGLESYHVTYDTRVTDAEDLISLRDHPSCTAQPDLAAAAEASCRLALLGLPPVFHELEWDLIMVDAPTGWTPESPGRMGAIYTAGMAARARRPGTGATDVFVHDVDRPVEDSFSKAFLCEGYLAEQVGRIRHFVVPSHREKDGTPFCP